MHATDFLCLVNGVIFVAELVGIEVFASLFYNWLGHNHNASPFSTHLKV